MTSNEPKPTGIHARRNKVIILSSVAVLSAILIYNVVSDFIPSDIQLSDLPIEKLNQGYDLVCNAKSTHELCLLNMTSRITVNPEDTVIEPLKIGNSTARIVHKVITVKSAVPNYCLMIFYANWQNQSKGCLNTKSFDKNYWTAVTLHDKQGNENLIVFKSTGNPQ